MRRPYIERGQDHHEQKGRQSKPDETRGRARHSSQSQAHVGGHLHGRGPGDGLTERDPITKRSVIQPPALLNDFPPDVGDHRRPAKGRRAQSEKGAEQVR
jgi:hypothetical protein